MEDRKFQPRVGALWVKSYQKDGQSVKYLTGQIELGILGKVSIVAFPITERKHDKMPHYNILISEQKTEVQSDPLQQPQAPSQELPSVQVDEVQPEDLPF